jgi:hypothetical protein
MANNKGKVENIHDLLPKHLNSRTNTNWKALVEALGEQDQVTADLVSEIRKQFFIKTASRPYIDRLASNHKISRPKFVGMDDTSFKQYIPVLSYKPKQVKLIIDQLLDIFFFKESTTAFITSQGIEPYDLNNGWELEFSIDENNLERIVFNTADFTNISSASANEIAAAYNRQAKYSYATAEYDSITKNTYVKVFTNTVGSKGSIRILGGRANIALKFNGFLTTAGNGSNTQWTVTKIGEDVYFQHTAGTAPGIDKLNIGDIVIIDIVGNTGSFEILEVDIPNNRIKFKNLFATVGVFTQTNSDQIKFIRPKKNVAFLNAKRAISWETSPSEIVVEMPTSPPVVKRSLKGSAHLNGVFSIMSSRDSNTSLTVSDATGFPNSGTFFVERVNDILHRILTPSEDETVEYVSNSRLISSIERYEYTSRTVLTTTGDIIEGQTQITNLASVAGLAIGQEISMVGVPPYAKVTSIAGFTANISVPATATSSGTAVSFLGNQLTGVSPNLPVASSLNQYTLSSQVRSANVVTNTTIGSHNYVVGDRAIITGSAGINTVTATGDIAINSNQILNISSVSGLAPDMLISGPGIPTGTKIVSIVGLTITMSEIATSTTVGATINFREDINGTFYITSTPTANTFTYTLIGANGTAVTPGTSRVEKMGMATSGSKIFIIDSSSNDVSRISGPYMWDETAPFVLSSHIGETAANIQAGKIIRLLDLGTNDIPSEGGYIVFDYGLETQEGPIRYLYKPTDNTIAIDPSYTFKHTHASGSLIVMINRSGPHSVSTSGKEYSAYITDPSAARVVLQELIRSVKSAGIFVNFLVRYPENLYATIDCYNSGIDPG